MARVEFLPDVYEDLRRVVSHLEQHEAEHIQDRLGEIVSASDVLTDNPLIGRQTRGDLRELVIGRGSRGYIALYRYVAAVDTVFVLAIRAQREGGYARDE
jgi:toxin ParE1/3/4